MSNQRKPVTIAQLKRHMDRRFDRLERMKADKLQLRQFATKRELRRFATKKDLRRFATKTDLRRFATDIKRYFDVIAEDLRENLQKVAEGVAGIPAINEHLAHHDKV